MTRLRLGEDLAVDDVRLLPQQVRVEGPHVAEAVLPRRAWRAATVREAGGLVCRTTPKSIDVPFSVVDSRLERSALASPSSALVRSGTG